MPRTGRVTKLTPAIQEAIARAVTAGAPLVQAAELAGVDKGTVLEWMARGEDRHPSRPSRTIYAEFADAITHARAADEIRRIARIDAAAKGGAVVHEETTTFPDGRTVTKRHYAPPDWRADAFHLEAAYRERWGKQQRVDLQLQIEKIAAEVAAEVGVPVQDILREAQAVLREHDQRHGR